MKTYGVKVAFYADEHKLVLYYRCFPITETSEERAKNTVTNVLHVMEFHNFEIVEVKEIEH